MNRAAIALLILITLQGAILLALSVSGRATFHPWQLSLRISGPTLFIIERAALGGLILAVSVLDVVISWGVWG
jgi:hypothetical protein